MIKCAICDDEYNVADAIEKYITEKDKRIFQCDIFSSAEEFIGKYNEENEKYDVYFLDIEMGKISGLELAKKIRTDDINALIIFITSHTEYVYDVFEMVTFDFITKPVSREKIEKLLDKVKSYLCVSKTKFVFSYNKNTYSLAYDSILYLEKMGRKVMLYTKEGDTYQSNMNLTQIWNQLSEKMFGQLSKSCIVNLRWISSIDAQCVIMDNKTKLYIARNYRKEIRKAHLKFLEEQL